MVLCSAFAWTTLPEDPDWGFFGHRRINRLAVFTLDEEMMPFFRAHVEWLTEHAVDPDKRRYASKHEAVRHYIDIDHWGERGSGFPHVPRRWTDALLWKAELLVVVEARDTQVWHVDTITHPSPDRLFSPDSRVLLRDQRGASVELQLGAYRSFWISNVLPQYYEDAILLQPDSLRAVGFPVGEGTSSITVRENFSSYGILPYHLESMHRRITKAFKDENADQILRLCAEMGHYVGDAHVPLHTTENYNGQLSGQTGIHAFWESRLPELFADEEYDFFVGKAEYIENPREYYWEIVLKSHSLVDSVFRTEQRLRDTYPEDQQMCFEERLGRTVSTQCAEFSAAWDREMQGMVEERFRAAIHSIGSVWYSCWVDAGQPDLRRLVPRPTLFAKSDTLDRAVQAGAIKGRVHE
ncbi:hypothetical protein H9S92_11080 [Lewinella lacunae]|uniref:S1/P1 Nuclease n=1 Tax=Neolewinella lacunae TaxID=1517758 RepID=A0A923PIJ0_9BACT|nr:hypothetical protein [Neolewinella lacunae]